MTYTQALAESLNIPAVKISEHIGRDTVQKIAWDFGLQDALQMALLWPSAHQKAR